MHNPFVAILSLSMRQLSVGLQLVGVLQLATTATRRFRTLSVGTSPSAIRWDQSIVLGCHEVIASCLSTMVISDLGACVPERQGVRRNGRPSSTRPGYDVRRLLHRG
jgi:hypothetical protein